MRLVTFSHGSVPGLRAGALVDEASCVVDLQAAHDSRFGVPAPALSSVLAILEAGVGGLELAHDALRVASESHRIPIDGVRLRAPIPAPPQMRDFLCFEKHLVQAFAAARKVRASGAPDPQAAERELEAKGVLTVPAAWYERPLHYHPNRLNVIGHGEDVAWPAFSEKMDFELEFGCYIGRRARDVPREKARKLIAGYTIFNDLSARDEQLKEMAGQLGPGKGKTFDGSNVMGPCLVTADELADPYNLEMVVRVNGEEWGRGNSRDMHWKFEDCIAHVSRSETLHPGEFFGSGTVGNGCGMEQMRFLKPGDVVEMEVERIGTLRNRIGSATA